MAVTTEMDVRYRDLDMLGHVNNAVFSTYLEEARLAYVEEVFGTDLAEQGMVIVHLEIDFARSIDVDDEVSVTVSVPEIGSSSVPMEYEIVADGETAATAETTLVFLDDEHEGSAPIPEEIRRRIEGHEGLR